MNTTLDLALECARVTEAAAIAAGRWLGHGDNHRADQAAVEAMRSTLDSLDLHGTVVIGEGERDEAPMLFIGERIGKEGNFEVDIAVDPLEGTNLVARGQPGSTAVIAVAEKGGLLHAPDTYMEKLIVGPTAAGKIDLNFPVRANLRIVADSLSRRIEELTVVVLDRERHRDLIREIREVGARIKMIPDGDLGAAISVAVSGTGDHVVMGTGGAPEGVLAAAALRCLGGEILARIKPRNAEEATRAESMGIALDRVYNTRDLASGEHVFFCATGVTSGDLLKGVQYFAGGARTHSLVMSLQSGTFRFLDTVHMFDRSKIPGVRL
ncbi:MAG: class II fructose-bisphosphatase [Chloroflexi bacterium]|nr:class II fructose-bisphosphatase [Chloroflexota bacterium]